MGGILGFYGEPFRRAMKTQIPPIQHVIFPVQETQNWETAVKSRKQPWKVKTDWEKFKPLLICGRQITKQGQIMS